MPAGNILQALPGFTAGLPLLGCLRDGLLGAPMACRNVRANRGDLQLQFCNSVSRKTLKSRAMLRRITGRRV